MCVNTSTAQVGPLLKTVSIPVDQAAQAGQIVNMDGDVISRHGELDLGTLTVNSQDERVLKSGSGQVDVDSCAVLENDVVSIDVD